MTDLQSKQKGESAKAHQAYLDYRDMGVSRSLRKLQEQYAALTSPADCPTKRLGTLESWSSNFDWQKRITEHDQQLQAEKAQADKQARTEERQRRTKMLNKIRKKVKEGIDNMQLETELDVKKFNSLMRAFKNYMELSMKQYNDLPIKQEEVTSRNINVNFVTEPIPASEVDERLKQLGLAHYVEEQTE